MADDLIAIATQGKFGKVDDRIVAIALQGQYRELVYASRGKTIREAAPLTTSYVTPDRFNMKGANQLQLFVSFIKGDSDGCRLKIDFSEDGIEWFQETSCLVSGELYEAKHKPIVRSIDLSSDVLISMPVWTRFLRISALAVTSGTGTSLSIMALTSNINTGADIIHS